MIVKFAGQTEGRRVEEPVQHIDLMPTVLDALGLPVPAELEGISLARPQTLSEERAIYSHLRHRGRRNLSVVAGEWKLIQRDSGGRASRSLFHWKDDPRETRDLSGELPIRTAVLASMLELKWTETRPPEPAEEIAPDEEFKRELKALGYLQ